MRRSVVRRVFLLAVIAACGRGSVASTAGDFPRPEPTSRTISPEELRRDLYIFASDSFRGRETGTPDARRAAAFIADRLMSIGVEPAGDSMYVQRVPLLAQRLTKDTRFTVSDGRSTRVLSLADLSPVLSLGEGAPEPKRTASGDLVFAGYGIQSKAVGRDDLSKVELEGKVVVIIHGAPPTVNEKVRQQLEGQPELTARLGRLLPFHPTAIVVLMNEGTRGFYDQVATQLQRVVLPGGQREPSSDAERPLPMILLGVAKPGSPLLPARWPEDDRPQPLTGRRFSGTVQTSRDPFTAYNVVGVVRGTERKLNQTYVAFGAHYDHIGVQPPVNGDSIANGADDDGSGSMALLAIARRLVASPSRRSALLVWHVAEEKGLLGSAYFTEHATVPIDSVVAQLNADMIGRNAPQQLYVVGPQAAPNNQSKALGRIVDSVNAALPRPFVIDREYDAPDHPEQLYQRSDHYNYARQGVPIVFFTTGLHADYHRVSDEPSKIDYDKLARVATLILEVGKAVGERATRPR